VAPVSPVTDDYYGTKIVDWYRYMGEFQPTENNHNRTGWRAKFPSTILENVSSDLVL
jgi:hypothetical protein